MSDNGINVRISGDSSGIQKAMTDAANAVKDATGSIAGFLSGLPNPMQAATAAFAGLGSGASEHMGRASEAVKGGTEQIKSSLEGLSSPLELVRSHFASFVGLLAGGAAFKESISATKEFTGEVTKLSKQAGISAQDASGLNIALGDIGSDADTYTGALAKLTRQVRTNEEGLNKMGIATRDSNGQYLDGRELMDSAITTLNTYKEGTDRNLASQVAFGKGAADSAALLRLSTQVQEEGRKKAEELNLVIGPGTQAAVKAYKQAMNDVGDVMTGIEVTLGKAVMPVLTDLAQWFAAKGPAAIAIFKPVAAGIADTLRIVIDVVKDLWTFFSDTFAEIGRAFNEASDQSLTFGQFVGNAFAVVGIALLGLKEAFQVTFEVLRTAVSVVGRQLETFAGIAVAAFHLDWAGVKAQWKAGLADVESEVSASMKRIGKIEEDSAEAMKKLALGEGYKRPDTDDSKVAKKPSGRGYHGDEKTDGATIMARYEAELAAQKLAIDQKNAIDGTYYTMSKQAESDFWAAKLATVSAASKEYPQIQKKSIDAQLAASKEAFDGQLALLNKQEEAAKYDYDKKLALANQEVLMLRQHYLEDSKEVQAGLEKITKLQQEQAAQALKIGEAVAQAKRDAALGSIALQEQQAQLEVSLLQKTDAQLLADLETFENQRYAIMLAAFEERKALVEQEGSPAEKAKLKGEEVQLEQQHQQKILSIQGQAAIQQNALAKSLFGTLQTGFANVVKGAMTGTLNMRDVMKQAYNSIADALSQAVSKMVTEWLLGELRKKAATLETSMAQLQAAAVNAAGNAYNAIVGIPYVGPVLAPAAAAVAYAGVMAFGASASAEGGYDIPASVNPITQLHAREMVLPAPIADTVRNAMTGDGAGGQGGGTTVHNHFNGPTSRRDHERWIAELLPNATQIATRNFGMSKR